MSQVTVEVNGQKTQLDDSQSLLLALNKAGFNIPFVCFHPDFELEENCRLCLVEVDGKIKTSCSVRIKEGMKINTNSPKISALRKTNAELLLSNFEGTREDFSHSKLSQIATDLQCDLTKFKPRKADRQSFDYGKILYFDLQKCIDCRTCIKACAAQNTRAITFKGYGFQEQVTATSEDRCVYCGQCMAHCPSGAIHTDNEELKKIKELLQDKNYITVAQVAPAVRASIGELFGMPVGTVVTKKLVTSLKKLGFQYVFDTSMSADVTTMEEAKELVKRIKNKENLPLMTSCCPGWVRYLGVYFPKLLPHLTTAHSPQIMLGNIIKFYWAKKMNLDINKVRVISIMPCLAKKWESKREDYKVDDQFPVDYVLTTVEAARLMEQQSIDLSKELETEFDHPLGEASGAGLIYGASGGVMVSALRTGYYMLTGKNPEILEFDKITALDGYKEMDVWAPGVKLKVAALDGLGNVAKILPKLKEFDYVEVMACRGGCIGGGGQPYPVSDEIRKTRAQSLFNLDRGSTIRLAHESPTIKTLYQEFLTTEEIAHKYCHYHGHNAR